MSPKFHGLLTLGLLCLAFSAAGAYALFRPVPAPVPAKGPRPFENSWFPSPSNLKELSRLNRNLASLKQLPGGDTKNASLTLFTGPEDKPAPAPVKPREKKQPPYTVTLALVSEKTSFCIINNRLYTTGDLLPGGETILEIETRRIRIGKEGGPIWLSMAKEDMK